MTAAHDPLANPVWSALTTRHERFAVAGRGAHRYQDEVAPFSALPDQPAGADWEELASLVGPGLPAVLFRGEPAFAVPEGWRELARWPSVQMSWDGPPPTGPLPLARRGEAAEVLGPADLPEMLDLVERTHPGPFGRRTPELGRYLGLRRDGRLVAMAGERMRVEGGTEVSAVCTDDAHRGQGLAAALVLEVVVGILERGDLPFLHAVASNEVAIRLYERLGFRHRRALKVVAALTPGEPDPSFDAAAFLDIPGSEERSPLPH